MNNVLGPRLRLWLDSHEEELITFRRHLHAHPEPSGLEHETTKSVVERLEVAGLQPRVLSCGTGLVCDFGENDGPIVALRADIDALRMDDEKEAHYRSQVPGVAHACGHDVHTTVLLGTGIYLSHLAGELSGRIRLIFQPAEERVPGGALDVIADNALDDVAAIFGLHCDPKLDVGRVGLRAGAITSAGDQAEIVVSGPGGHTARPELTVNLLEVAAKLIIELPDRIRVELGELGPVKAVFGSVHGGEAGNVIPTHSRLRMSIRTPSMEAWEAMSAAVESAIDYVLAGTGAQWDTSYTRGVPPVLNDAAITETARNAIRGELGDSAVTEAIQSWGGDDYAWFLREVPGTYIRLGTHDPKTGENRLDLHVGHFDVDERAIAVGVQTLTACAYRYLEKTP